MSSLSLVIKIIFLCFVYNASHYLHSLLSSQLFCLSSSVYECSMCSDGCPVAWLTSFWDGSSWHWLVGHWHGCLNRALAEQSSIGCPVFAADRGHGGTAEGQRQVPASGSTECPSCPMTLLEEGGHREPWQPPVSWIVSSGQGLQGLTRLHTAHVQGRDLDRLAWQLLVSQVFVHEAVQTMVYLFQVHLFVLKIERSQYVYVSLWCTIEGGA